MEQMEAMAAAISFNSQPPEGGCVRTVAKTARTMRFNSQPPEGGCWSWCVRACVRSAFQFTAARRRLRLHAKQKARHSKFQFTAARRRLHLPPNHITGPPMFQFTAARRRLPAKYQRWKSKNMVSIHSRPKAAASGDRCSAWPSGVSIHSRPKAAARVAPAKHRGTGQVSIHSRPKAAARSCADHPPRRCSFNSQPPEGGCAVVSSAFTRLRKFQFTAARRRLRGCRRAPCRGSRFNSQPPEGGCPTL